MGKISAKGAVITLTATDVSTYCESYEIDWAQDVVDVTGFGDTWKNNIGGQRVVGFTLNMLWEKTAVTGTLAKCLGLMTTAGTCSIVPEATGPTFSGTFLCDGVKAGGNSGSGAISLGSVHFSASGVTIATFA